MTRSTTLRTAWAVLAGTARAALLACVLASLSAPSGQVQAQNIRDPRVDALEWRQRPGAQLPLDVPLRDEHGGTTTLRTASGGLPFVLAPGYFRCAYLCGVVRDDLFGGLERTGLVAGRDYTAIVLSIDPAEGAADAASAREALLSRYAGGGSVDRGGDAASGPETGWRFLTGTADAVGAEAGAAGFQALYDAPSRQFLHPAGILFASPSGRISGYAMGVGYGPDALAAGIAAARDGRQPGSADGDGLAQAVLLLCGRLGAAMGRNTPTVTAALRVVAACAALLLAAWLWRLHTRRDRTAAP